MFVRSRYRYYLDRQALLDARDSKIESENMLSALNGSPVKNTKGLIVRNAAHMTEEDRVVMAKKMNLPETKDFSNVAH